MLGRRLRTPQSLVAVAAVALALPLSAPAGADDGIVYEVSPGEDIQAVLDAAQPGDTIVLLAGTHRQAIEVRVPDIVVRGEGAAATTLDGTGIDRDGIFVTADGVTVEDLTVQNFGGNGVFYSDVTGFYMSRIRAVDNGPYGLYAIRSQVGFIEDSYASGHSDSGFYIGEVEDCQCVLRNLEARDNLIGYSGTGASKLTIRDSLWENNSAGIVPNVLPSEPQPQLELDIVNNVVRDNNNCEAMVRWHFGGGAHVPCGLGIVIAGGSQNLVRENLVTGHDRAGIVVAFLFTEPSLNCVRDNTVNNPGPDILWDEGGANNGFQGNLRPDGSPATFSAGPLWGTLGSLPDCSTPNAAPPSPATLARLGALLVFGCEPEEIVEELTLGYDPTTSPGCHLDHLG